MASSLTTRRNQVPNESALTATGIGVGFSISPNASRASRSSNACCRPYRAITAPESVSFAGLERTSRTRPVRCSSSLMRWLTADGVTCSALAAASNVPSSTTASKVRTHSGSIITVANDT